MNQDDELTEPELLNAGRAVAGLSRPAPPAGLAARTLAYVVAQCAPVRKRLWILRPITHPLARVLAAAGIMLTLFPMTTLDLAAPLGTRIEEHVVGRKVVDRVEGLVDRLLVRNGPASYSQADLDAVVGVVRVPANSVQRFHSVRPGM
jgi:hypothetical protein